MTKAASSEARSTRTSVWIGLSVIALTGIVVAIATSSWWPLIAFAGLALPMIPVRSVQQRK